MNYKIKYSIAIKNVQLIYLPLFSELWYYLYELKVNKILTL